ncbi:hypothetical protein F0562_018543 [Nyssa sinensis]|uniref:Uncharacterized protein n=1 Tax=Nyssa sinensis TaxID=561372 RepID=A0A5J4ZD87_9ASTE|nr:hypothetical protein F0562_018543 [Nyssa sinensis]
MATTMPKKMCLDVAADMGSADSLSFAGLVCVQDQHLKSQPRHVLPLPPGKNATRIQIQDPEFELGQSTPGSTANSPDKNSLADLLFSNGQLLPQGVPFQSNHSPVSKHVSFTDSSPTTRSSSKRSSDNESGPNKASRNQTNKDRTTASQSFGQKIFRSFATPCRNCRALEPSPSLKVHSSLQGNMKLHVRRAQASRAQASR